MPPRQVYGARWDLTEGIDGAEGRTHQVTLTHPQSWLTRKIPDYWKLDNVALQEQLEGERREL